MKLGLGLALSKWGFRGSGGGDPLAGLPRPAFRFQTHDGLTRRPSIQGVRVSGAGTCEVNGLYYPIPQPLEPGAIIPKDGNSSLPQKIRWQGNNYWRIDYSGADAYESDFAADSVPLNEQTWNNAGVNTGALPTPATSYEMVDVSVRDCIVVEGAGIDAANGRYYQPNPESLYWSKPGGFAVGWNLGFGDAWYLALNADILYDTPSDSSGDPSALEWTATDPGYGDAPHVSRVSEPQYTAKGIVQTDGQENPTISDVWQSGGLVIPQPTTTARGLTRRRAGVPVLYLDGADDLYMGEYSTPHSRDDYTVALLTRRQLMGDGSWRSPWFGGPSNGGYELAGGVSILGHQQGHDYTNWGCHNPWVDANGPFIERGSLAFDWQVSCLRRSNSDPEGRGQLKLWVEDQTTDHEQTWHAVETAFFTIGGQGTNNGVASFAGDVIAVIHWRTALSDEQVQTVLDYLQPLKPTV